MHFTAERDVTNGNPSWPACLEGMVPANNEAIKLVFVGVPQNLVLSALLQLTLQAYPFRKQKKGHH